MSEENYVYMSTEFVAEIYNFLDSVNKSGRLGHSVHCDSVDVSDICVCNHSALLVKLEDIISRIERYYDEIRKQNEKYDTAIISVVENEQADYVGVRVRFQGSGSTVVFQEAFESAYKKASEYANEKAQVVMDNSSIDDYLIYGELRWKM